MAWMIYGANGYTGQLVAEAAAATGERLVLAGRSDAAVRALADRTSLPWQNLPDRGRSATRAAQDLRRERLHGSCRS